MKGYWHIATISVVISICSILFQNILFLIGVLVWLMALLYFRRLGKAPIFISLAFILFFTTYIPSFNESPEPKRFPNEVKGKVISPIKTTDKTLQFQLRENKTMEVLQVFSFLEQNHTNYFNVQYGANCTISGIVTTADSSRNPGQFDYQNYLRTNNIEYQLMVDSVKSMDCEPSSDWLTILYHIRDYMSGFLQNKYQDFTAGWILALVFGEDSVIPDSQIELFQRWGLSHLLAISGLHVGIVVGILYFSLIKMDMWTKEKTQWFVVCFLPVYALIAGGAPSVWRASLMVMLALLLNRWKLKYSLTDIISIIFLLLLLVDPFLIYQLAFQYSFLVTFAIILSREWLAETQSRVFQVLKISFLSSMVLIPLQITHFYTIQPLSILLNVLVVPYFTFVIIPFIFFLLFFSPLPIISEILDKLFQFIHETLFFQVISFLDDFLYFPWALGHFPIVIIVGYYALFIGMMYSLNKFEYTRAFKYGVFIILLLLFVQLKPYLTPYGTVTMLDIGQGDSIIIELPYRKGVIVIDAGARYSYDEMEASESVFEQVIKPYLLSKGILHIDAIFVTHDDLDHYGSVEFIMEEFNVSDLYISKYHPQSEVVEKWKELGGRINHVGKNQIVSIGSNQFHVLSPSANTNSSNNNSLVLFTKIGGKKWLFTGDIEKEVEEQLINYYGNLTTDVLKVAHHGSSTSTTEQFVTHIQPEYGWISVGKENQFNHPTPEVMDRLEKHGITILRTDEDGAVIYRFRGEEGTFFTYLP